MKMKVRLLLPTMLILALTIALLGGFLIYSSFTEQIDLSRKNLESEMQSLRQDILSDYALRNIVIDDEWLTEKGLVECERTSAESLIWLENEILYAQSSVDIAGRTYLLKIEKSVSEIYRHTEYIQKRYVIAYLAAMLLLGLTLTFLVQRITQPLEKLTSTSRALMNGNLDMRVDIHDTDEVGELAATFNAMADALSDQLNRQEQFINALTHEMKTPIAAMIGHADNMRTGRLSQEEMMCAANTIVREGKRLDALSERMTQWILMHHDMPDFCTIATDMLLRECAEMFDGKQVRLDDDSRNHFIQVDHILMMSLLLNLIRNALNASSTQVWLKCECITDDKIRIIVSDNGCGMPEESLPHITEPFYRVDKARSRAKGGAGLGLTLCSKIAHLHNGTLRFESKVGNGTSVIIELPVKQRDGNPEKSIASGAE